MVSRQGALTFSPAISLPLLAHRSPSMPELAMENILESSVSRQRSSTPKLIRLLENSPPHRGGGKCSFLLSSHAQDRAELPWRFFERTDPCFLRTTSARSSRRKGQLSTLGQPVQPC